MDAFDELGEWLEENTEENKEDKMTDKAMRICDNKGFQLDLPNGVTVSVQWGPMNYCDSDVRNAEFDAPRKAIDGDRHWGSNTAECAAYLTGSDLAWVGVPGYTDSGDDDVCGYMNVPKVLDFINKAASMRNPVANPKSHANQMMGVLDHGDYRDDPKLLEDERKIMDNLEVDEFFSGLHKFSGSSPIDES